MIENLKAEYHALLESGTLLEVFPNFKGVWEQDKDKFLAQHRNNEDFLNDIEIDDDDEDIEYIDDTIYNY